MSRYIDADALINYLDELCDSVCVYSKKQREFMCGACALGNAFDVIEEFPTADVREIVRCKYCKHYSSDGLGYGNCYRGSVGHLRMADNNYCRYGERREDEQIH